jgi:hypothetical protein
VLNGTPNGWTLKGSYSVPAAWHIAAQDGDIAVTSLDVTPQGPTHRIDPEKVDDRRWAARFDSSGDQEGG